MLRRQVEEGSKSFVPHQKLFDLLDRDVIQSVLQEGEVVPWYNLDSIVDRIYSGARRIFAILVVLKGQEREILRFLEHESFQNSPPDHRLPFSESELKRIAPEIVIEFYEKQWEFTAPVFVRSVDHRHLQASIVLPFLEDKKIGEGGFGEVFKITLDPTHQDLSLISPSNFTSIDNDWSRIKGSEFVRKQFPELLDDNDSSHEQELRNLSLLNQLKHPNILELLSFYTYRRRRNFIFPFAENGDLESWLKKDSRPPNFTHDFAFLCALCGLASGIAKIHNYTTEKNLEIRLIGLHRDLKPNNILVNADRFLVADFGLSKFKSGSQTSKTPHRGGGGDYLPPESEDLEDGMRKGLISRSSDIWSLGCIILEVLTFMLRGAKGVVEFKRKRKIHVAEWKVTTFYGKGRQVSSNVIEWMTALREICSPSEKQLVNLIQTMLLSIPDHRPDAATVANKLCLITITELLDVSIEKFESLMAVLSNDNKQALQGFYEYRRFQAWQQVFRSIAAESSQEIFSPLDLDLEQTMEVIKAIHKELSFLLVRNEIGAKPTYSDLHHLGDRLMELFPKDLQARVHSYQDLQLLKTGSDILHVSEEDLDPIAPKGSRIRFLAFIKSMLDSADQHLGNFELVRAKQGKPRLSIEVDEMVIEGVLGDHNLAWRKDEKSGLRKRVLIEWITYDMHWEDEVREELLKRVGNIAQFLNEVTVQADAFGLLHCLGYFLSIGRNSFGLVYELPLPQAIDSAEYDLKTLSEIIRETQGLDRPSLPPPYLGDRFALAQILSTILLDLHKASLVHKRISSLNIVFFSFPPVSSPSVTSSLPPSPLPIRNPYLIGFNHSRPNDPHAVTSGPPSSHEACKYLAPEYAPVDARFCLEFDYYSLGLVLLEIGLWDTVTRMGRKTSSAKELRQILLERRVPMLGHLMGESYRDAVRDCLKGDFGRGGNEETAEGGGGGSEDERVMMEFDRRIIGRLRGLAA